MQIILLANSMISLLMPAKSKTVKVIGILPNISPPFKTGWKPICTLAIWGKHCRTLWRSHTSSWSLSSTTKKYLFSLNNLNKWNQYSKPALGVFKTISHSALPNNCSVCSGGLTLSSKNCQATFSRIRSKALTNGTPITFWMASTLISMLSQARKLL